MRSHRRKTYKKKRLRGALLRLIPFILFCGAIWYSSSQTYEQQSLIPILDRITSKELFRDQLNWIEFTYAGSVVSIDAKGYAGFVEFFLRKGAHVGFFFMIGLFLSSFLHYVYSRLLVSSAATFLFLLFFASLDEYRQYLTGGRTPLIQDVLLDMAGGILAIVVYSIYRYRKSKGILKKYV
ncbi:VanZ family protein [Jeotgalibacillus sp. ET6]|uniref:VanZ family protein n=1 Tax=Jeotgalibacillus sp. ET6 TaxID=3037260 RepID=UPI0024185E16|nr:VanZ family protein [Jeotgalibacillus sp. ET6]MDG5471546.1 VanZ family protein [Jeotgalibacillus sp. ET6]